MPTGYHHLTYEERCRIYALKQRGDSQHQIAKHLRVSRSTISREIRRNSGLRGYRYKQAEAFATERRKRASRSPRKMHEALIEDLKEKLGRQWSPEQISGWFRRHRPKHAISHTTIYNYLWEDRRRGGTLYKQLRHNGKKYRRQNGKTSGRGCLPNRVGIEKRPKSVEAKSRIGDWGLDTVIGCRGEGVIVSMVDRASKLTRLAKAPSKHAKIVYHAIVNRLSSLGGEVHTLTADNGKEFANHEHIAASLGSSFFFANPYSSWERGLNEHTNGLLRQYFPKGKSLKHTTQADLDEVELLLNNRPRKVLQYETPIEVFERLKKKSADVALRN